MKIFEQLVVEGLLSEDQANSLAKTIESKVQMEVDVIVEQKVGEAKVEWEKQATEYLEEQYGKARSMISEKQEMINSLQEQLEAKEADIVSRISALEESTISKLDLYLDQVSTKKIQQELVESVAQKEVYQSIVESVMAVLAEKLPMVDTSHSLKVESLSSELNKQKANTESLTKMLKEANDKNEQLKKGLLIVSESRGLTDAESQKMYNFFESKSFDETRGLIKEYKETLAKKSTTSMRDKFKQEQRSVATETRQLAENKTATEVSLDETRSIEKVIEQTAPKSNVINESSNDYNGLNINQLDELLD